MNFFNNAAKIDNDGEIVAFVGRKVFLEKRHIPEFGMVEVREGHFELREIPDWNTRFEARYEILDVLKGNLSQPTIDFEMFDHYGRSDISNIETPLIVLTNAKGRWVRMFKTHLELHPTLDDDWAICGEKNKEMIKHLRLQPNQNLVFRDEVKDDNDQQCASGMRVSDVFNKLYETRMSFEPSQNH